MVETIIQQLGGGYWLPKLPALQQDLVRAALTKDDIDELVDKALHEAKANHKGRALNFAALALICNEPVGLAIVRRRGLLRATAYDLDHRVALHVATELLRFGMQVGFKEDTRAYFTSFIALLKAAPAIRRVRESLKNEIRLNSTSLLKGCLAVVDYAYLTGDTGVTGLPPEDLAEGCSYLHALQVESIGAVEELRPYDEQASADGYYHYILEAAYRVRCYYAFEIALEEFRYRFSFSDALTVEPPNADFEKSLRLGYINIEQQILKSILEIPAAEIGGYDIITQWFAKRTSSHDLRTQFLE